MKQLILTITIALGLCSCKLLSTKLSKWIIVDIENDEKGYCIYELESFGLNTYFYEKCDKYSIGDTIYLTKNKQ